MTDIDFVRPPCKVLLVCRSNFHTLRCPDCNCRCNWSLRRCNSGRQGTRMRDPLKHPSKCSSWLLSLLQGSIKTNRSRSARSYPGDVRHQVRCRAANNARLTDGPRRTHRRTRAESTVRMEFYHGHRHRRVAAFGCHDLQVDCAPSARLVGVRFSRFSESATGRKYSCDCGES
jgi:hypothetical protein